MRHLGNRTQSVGVGDINAISGGKWAAGLHQNPQDYAVCPPQPWLDGINSGEGKVRQFVATPLGKGLTVEAQLGVREVGGIRLRVYDPKPGIFPDEPPPPDVSKPSRMHSLEFGLGPGGHIRQKIYPDPHGIDVWDSNHYAEVWVHLVNSGQYRTITGQLPPPTPIEYQTYIRAGLPWFELYDELGDVPAAEPFRRLRR